jgi:hypothetical protein
VQGLISDPSLPRRWNVFDYNAFCSDSVDCNNAVATEELGKVYSRVQPIKTSCMVLPDTAHELVEVIQAKVLVVTSTSTLGAPLAMDFSMTGGPLASHNENHIHS